MLRPLLKSLATALLNRGGLMLRHCSDDPLINELDRVRDVLRLAPNDCLKRNYLLGHLGSMAHLTDLLNIHNPDLVVDVGANRGQFASLVRHIGYKGRMVSFEPQLNLAQKLNVNSIDPLWTVIHGAVGESSGNIELQIYEDDSFSSLHELKTSAHDRFGTLVNQVRTEKVLVRPLDDWLDADGELARRVLLKTDTQGHDLAVLRGASSILARACVVMAEAAFLPSYEEAPLFPEVVKYLETLDFRVSGFYPISHIVDDLTLIEADAFFVRSSPETSLART